MATGRLTNPMRQIRRLALLGMGGISDAQLLDLFLTQNDEAAFEALVKRHGAMVLSVCRRILRDPHDVEDAFQATFLVLVRKAAVIAQRELLGNWLYGVAFRAALKLKQAKTTRQFKERQVKHMARQESSSPDIPEELLFWLDHELNQLPEKYRAAIVFCDLEGMTRNQAARKLGWPLGTLNWRLAKARAMVAKGLKRHGLALSGAGLAALFQKTAAAAVPTALVASTVKTGSLLAAGGAMTSGLVSVTVASLMEGVVKVMFLSKLKMATAILVVVGVLGAGAGGIKLGVLATEKGGTRAISVVTKPAVMALANATATEGAVAIQEEINEPQVGRSNGQVQLGNVHINGENLNLDPKNSIVEVKGPGVLTLLTSINFRGEKLPEPKRITVHWNKEMFLRGKYAEFHGAVQVSQDGASIKCRDMFVTLEGVVSIKGGQREHRDVTVEKLICDGKVLVMDDKKGPNGKRIQFDRLTATQLTVDNQDGPISAAGPGKSEHLAQGPVEVPVVPESDSQESAAKEVQVMKLTRIFFDGRMFSNHKDKTYNAKFYDNVEVFHFPTEDENGKMDPDNPPKNGFYMKCKMLSVFTRQIDNKTSQMMRAEGDVSFHMAEILGTAGVVKYDDSQEQVIFEGPAGKPATLYRKMPGKAQNQEIKASKILYNRKTGIFHLDGVKMITGQVNDGSDRDKTNVTSDWRDTFLTKKHDLGTAAHGAVLRHSLPMVNKSDARLEITNVRVSCGCLTAHVSKKLLRPNQTGFLELVLDTGRFSGPKTMEVYVNVAVRGEAHEFRLTATAVSFEETDHSEKIAPALEGSEPDPAALAPVEMNGQGRDGALYTKKRALRLPIMVSDAERTKLKQLLLFASRDQGRTYQQVAAASPDEKEFSFEASTDGAYWLKVALINRQGIQEPQNIQQGRPDQRIVIDTMKPVVQSLTARRQGDEVIVGWEIEEEHLDLQSFRLEYQFEEASPFWTKIPATPGLTGQAPWRATGAGAFMVRLIAKDKARNQSSATVKVAARRLNEDQGEIDWRSAQYQLALEEIDKKNYEQACEILMQNLESKGPAQDRSAHEKSIYKIAELFSVLKVFDKAVLYYKKAIEQYPRNPGVLAARDQLGECYYKLAKQALEKVKSANDEKKAYYQHAKQQWLEQAALVCESLAGDLEHKARQSPLVEAELNLLRKALFGAAELKFEMNDLSVTGRPLVRKRLWDF